MNRIRSLRTARLAVLLLHLLVMGIASAAPWLRADDGALAVRCGALRSAGLAVDDDTARTLDCPLCLPLQAPPVHAVPQPATSPSDEVAPGTRAIPGSARMAALPPARAPPRV